MGCEASVFGSSGSWAAAPGCKAWVVGVFDASGNCFGLFRAGATGCKASVVGVFGASGRVLDCSAGAAACKASVVGVFGASASALDCSAGAAGCKASVVGVFGCPGSASDCSAAAGCKTSVSTVFVPSPLPRILLFAGGSTATWVSASAGSMDPAAISCKEFSKEGLLSSRIWRSNIGNRTSGLQSGV